MVRVAARRLLDMVRPEDVAFLMNFNRETHIDADFTSNRDRFESATDRIDIHGFSAVWDAVGDSIQRLERSGKRERKLLVVVVAGGDDNPSHESFDQLLQQAGKSVVSVYSMGLTRGEARRDAPAARRAVRALAEASGGKDFYPKTLDQGEGATAQIAREIRVNSGR